MKGSHVRRLGEGSHVRKPGVRRISMRKPDIRRKRLCVRKPDIRRLGVWKPGVRKSCVRHQCVHVSTCQVSGVS